MCWCYKKLWHIFRYLGLFARRTALKKNNSGVAPTEQTSWNNNESLWHDGVQPSTQTNAKQSADAHNLGAVFFFLDAPAETNHSGRGVQRAVNMSVTDTSDSQLN